MMHWKTDLQQAFAPPPPAGKRAFLRQHRYPQMNMTEFLQSQLGYIRKRVWCIAALIFIIAVLGAVILSFDMLWIIASCAPILAMSLLSESGRSAYYEMAELEMATRFSLRNVILARLGLLGGANLLLFLLLLPIGLLNNTFTPFAAGLYIITPFMLTVSVGLMITRKFRGQDGLYACIALSVFVSAAVFLSHLQTPALYQEQHVLWWAFALTTLTISVFRYSAGIIQQTEELSWN